MLFGIFRYFLINLVVFAHIGPALLWRPGSFAVFGFFILSGFLATYSLDNKYGWKLSGVARYYANRVIRIYPTYYLSAIISIIVLLFFPCVSSALYGGIHIPESKYSIFSNLFILGIGRWVSLNESIRLVPVSWFLHSILIFYLIFPFIGRNIKRVFIWFAFSVIVCILISVFLPTPFIIRYSTLQAVSLPISVGALIYYLFNSNYNKVKYFEPIFQFRYFIIIVILFIINLITAKFELNQIKFTFYINIILLSYIIVFLSKVGKEKISRTLYKIDRFLGQISYPMFLVHWQVAVMVIFIFFNGIEPGRTSLERLELYLLTLPIVNIVSIFIYLFIRKYTKKLKI